MKKTLMSCIVAALALSTQVIQARSVLLTCETAAKCPTHKQKLLAKKAAQELGDPQSDLNFVVFYQRDTTLLKKYRVMRFFEPELNRYQTHVSGPIAADPAYHNYFSKIRQLIGAMLNTELPTEVTINYPGTQHQGHPVEYITPGIDRLGAEGISSAAIGQISQALIINYMGGQAQVDQITSQAESETTSLAAQVQGGLQTGAADVQASAEGQVSTEYKVMPKKLTIITTASGSDRRYQVKLKWNAEESKWEVASVIDSEGQPVPVDADGNPTAPPPAVTITSSNRATWESYGVMGGFTAFRDKVRELRFEQFSRYRCVPITSGGVHCFPI